MTSIAIPLELSTIGAESVKTCNARSVHAELGVKKDFSDWIKVQIKRAMLVENVDFVVLPQKGENLSGGRPALEYHLTIEAGKHIAMLSGTAKGRKVREYFLECERQAKEAAVALTPMQTLLLAAQRLVELEQLQQRQAIEIAQLQETVAVVEARTQPENKHFTVLGYCNLIGKPVDFRTASALGRKCAVLSREQGLQIGDVRDPRFGTVHSYHESVLQAVLASALPAGQSAAVG